MTGPFFRPRRLRTTAAMRRLVAETRLDPAQLVLPMFVADGIDAPRPISSMPGVVQHTEKSLLHAIEEALEAGVGAVDLFGVPKEEDKDPSGSAGIAYIRLATASSGPPTAGRRCASLPSGTAMSTLATMDGRASRR